MIVFLQNAWSPVYAGRVWPRESWLRALYRRRSGLRLLLLVETLNACENTTPEVSPLSSGVCPPCDNHINGILKRRAAECDIVIAAGKQAEEALCRLWSGPLLAVPHPASRTLTNGLYRRAARMLDNGYTQRLALRQLRGKVRVETL